MLLWVSFSEFALRERRGLGVFHHRSSRDGPSSPRQRGLSLAVTLLSAVDLCQAPGDGQHLNEHPNTHCPAPQAAQGGWKVLDKS